MNEYGDYLVLHSLFLLALFAAGIFVVLNGPLWLSRRARIFAGGPKAPTWLQRGVSWLRLLVGLAILVTWAWVSTGALKSTLLLGVAVAIGVFCLLDGPIWLVTRYRFFHRGHEAATWMVGVTVWFLRLGGVVVLLGALVADVRAATS